jgi:threonine dehydrogenase-like Zn-dependent dehydrogenase
MAYTYAPDRRSTRMNSTRQAQALWITAPARAELRTEHVPAPRDHEVLVQTLYSGISRGTEALIYHHAVPESEWQRMRAPFQEGQLPGPVKYGYANVGRVLEGPAVLLGRHVFCLYPHQSSYTVSAQAVHVIPADVPAARAVLAANMETAVNALWDARPLIGQRIVVVGAGVLGSLCAYLAARIPGCQVCLVDLHADRALLAYALGAQFALPDAAPHDADLVVHASASAEGLALALRLAADEATVLELSWYGDKAVALPLGADFHARRLQLHASQVGKVARAMRDRRSTGQRLELALSLLKDPALDALISSEGDFLQLPAALPKLLGADSRALCHRVRYATP